MNSSNTIASRVIHGTKPAYPLKLKFLETTDLLGTFLQTRQQDWFIVLQRNWKEGFFFFFGQWGLNEEPSVWNLCLDGWFAVSFPPLCGWRSVCPSLFTLHLQAGVKEKLPKDTQVRELDAELKVHQYPSKGEEESRLGSRLHGQVQVLCRDVQRKTGRSRHEGHEGHELTD